MDLGLERVTKLLESLAPPSSSGLAPHLAFPIIHVAGTNGKGSVCAYISSVLQQSGFRVGRYNSPHLITPRDTIQINNQPISQVDYDYATDIVKQKDSELGLKATSFELLTATAFYWFAYGRSQDENARVDMAVIEVGVGGRLDATNIVPRPCVCVITSIGMDHGALLGNTLQEVAFEKAGIIKPNVPAVIAPQAEGEKVYRVLEEKAKSVGLEQSQVIKVKAAHWIDAAQAPSTSATPVSNTLRPAIGHWAESDDGFKFWIPLLGDFQLENAATALAAISILRSHGADPSWAQKITEETIRNGIRNTVWPGRLQWIDATVAPKEVHGQMLVDGAHNPAAAIALRSYVDGHIASLSSTGFQPRTHWIMAFTKGKDIEEMFDILFSGDSPHHREGHRERRDTFSAVEFSPPEGMPWVSPISADEVCERLQKQQVRVHPREQDRLVVRGFGMDLRSALESVGRERSQGDVVVLCGSLYLVADLFRLQG